MNEKKYQIDFEFYGVNAKIISREQSIIEGLKRDFDYFISEDKKPQIQIECVIDNLPENDYEGYVSKGYGREKIVYTKNKTKIVDYRGAAYTVYDYDLEIGKVYSKNIDLNYEITYLLLMSRMGEHMDLKHIHRVHGFGLSTSKNAILCLLPEGGGKTTTFLDIIKTGGYSIYSDDTPLLKNGIMYPFPTRISLCVNDSEKIPINFKRIFRRLNRSDKMLVDLKYFNPLISKPEKVKHIIVGVKTLSKKSGVYNVNRFKSFKPLMRDLVFGLGIPQLIEYFLRYSVEDFLKKTGIFISRLNETFHLMYNSKTYIFEMGTDRVENSKKIIDFLDSLK